MTLSVAQWCLKYLKRFVQPLKIVESILITNVAATAAASAREKKSIQIERSIFFAFDLYEWMVK